MRAILQECCRGPTVRGRRADGGPRSSRGGGARAPGRPGPAAVPIDRLARVSMDFEIGRAKRGRRVYAFDDVAVVPSRRTRDPEGVSTSWTIDAFTFDVPFLSAPMDSVTSPATAIAIGRLGGVGVLGLEGLWT